jgi:hypothetical protein
MEIRRVNCPTCGTPCELAGLHDGKLSFKPGPEVVQTGCKFMGRTIWLEEGNAATDQRAIERFEELFMKFAEGR